MTERKPSNKRTKAPLTLEQARKEVLGKIAAKAAAGSGSPITAATKEPRQTLFAQALVELETERAIFADRTGAKPRFFLIDFAPSATTAAEKIERFAALRHPALLAAAELKKALAKLEYSFCEEAFGLLTSSRRLVKLVRKTSTVFAHGDSLRVMLGVGATEAPVPAEAIREGYENLVRLTGFPDVEIASLQRQSAVPLPALKEWLLAEHREGRAVFGLGDWSLADDTARAGVIELRGDRYLLVRLEV